MWLDTAKAFASALIRAPLQADEAWLAIDGTGAAQVPRAPKAEKGGDQWALGVTGILGVETLMRTSQSGIQRGNLLLFLAAPSTSAILRRVSR